MSAELQDLSRYIGILAAQRDEAREQLKTAREEIADLNYQLAALREELHRKSLDVEFLSLSHKLADSPQAVADARSTVKRMLTRVDKAIALIKEDARI